jgi:hypothetical protein
MQHECPGKESKLDIIRKVKELGDRILSVIFVAKPGDNNFSPRFIKIIDYFGYFYYILVDKASKLKEIYSIKEERYYEVNDERYKMKLDKASLNIITKYLGDKDGIVGGILFTVRNGLSYFSYYEDNVLPYEEVYVKSHKQKCLLKDNTQQVMELMIGEPLEDIECDPSEANLEIEAEKEIDCPIAYPVIEISNFLSEEPHRIHRVVRLYTRDFRVQKIMHEEEMISGLDKNLYELIRGYLLFEQIKFEAIKVLNNNIFHYEKQLKEIEDSNETGNVSEMRVSELRAKLESCHKAIIGITKSLCLISAIHKMIKWFIIGIGIVNSDLKKIIEE